MKTIPDDTIDERPVALHRYRVIATGLEFDGIVLDPYNLRRSDTTFLILQDDTLSCCEVRTYQKEEIEFVRQRSLKDAMSMAKLIGDYINIARDPGVAQMFGESKCTS